MMIRLVREISIGIAILILCGILAFIAPGFFSRANLGDMMLANMPVLIVALGMTLVILTGQIDISVGSQFAICGFACGVLAKVGLPTPVAGLITCIIGTCLGALNGALVAYVRIPSIVVTLATMVVFREGLRWATEGAWVQDLPPGFQWFGLSPGASESVTLCIAACLATAIAWALRNLGAGRAIYATGSDASAARLAGLNPALVTFSVFALTGALTGCAALLNSVRFNQIPSNAGVGLEMQVIAAVVVGGTAITGGRGTIFGVVLGVVLLGLIGPALTFLGVSAYWEKAIQGSIILTAVAADTIQSRARRHAGIVAARA